MKVFVILWLFNYLLYLRAKLETYSSLFPVLGFNSSKYDLNLTRKRFSDKPIVAFANRTVFIEDFYIYYQACLVLCFGIECLDSEENS